MTTQMEKLLEAEINFISNWTEYPENELEPMSTLDDARTQIDGILTDYDGDDFPEGLKDPEIMLMVWNHVIEDRRLRSVLDQDEKWANDHPGWLRFRNRYESGSSAFFDLDNLIADLHVYLHYDEEHCEIVREAMEAYETATT